MVINVQGYLIDTKLIYKISPVRGNSCWGRYKGPDDQEISDSGFNFTIYFLNGHEHSIHISDEDVFVERKITNDNGHTYTENWYKTDRNGRPYSEKYMKRYHKLREIMQERTQDFHDRIVAVWKENQSEIQSFELPEKHVITEEV